MWLRAAKTGSATYRHQAADESSRSGASSSKKRPEVRVSQESLATSRIKARRHEYGLTGPKSAGLDGYGNVPRNALAKFLGAEKFAELDPEKRKDTRLETGMKAVKKLIGMGEDAIVVKGVDNLLTTRANCCNPLRGEDIIGYISLGKGIVVHNKRCKNVSNLMVNKDRIVEVEWLRAISRNPVGLITGNDRDGRAGSGITTPRQHQTGSRDARANISREDKGLIEVTVEVFDKKHLDKVVSAIENVPDVIAVERMNTRDAPVETPS